MPKKPFAFLGRSVTSSVNLNLNDLKFEDPFCNELINLHRHYYTQALKYQGKDLYLTSDWFASTGLKDTIDRKKEIMISMTPEFRTVLKNIEEVAMRSGLKLPPEYQNVVPNMDIFKQLPDRQNLYLKLNYDACAFDKNGQSLNFDQLVRGDYRVVVHVKGLYIGFHPSGKLVSLQLRVSQLQHVPRPPQSMFAPIPFPTPRDCHQNHANVTFRVQEAPQPVVEGQQQQSQAKRGRKPTKLQRQNAMIEARIQQEEHRQMENIPAEFFRDAMMDLQNISTQ